MMNLMFCLSSKNTKCDADFCRNPDRGHCITQGGNGCSSTNICEETVLCIKHCKHKNHNDCDFPICNSINLCDNTDLRGNAVDSRNGTMSRCDFLPLCFTKSRPLHERTLLKETNLGVMRFVRISLR